MHQDGKGGAKCHTSDPPAASPLASGAEVVEPSDRALRCQQKESGNTKKQI